MPSVEVPEGVWLCADVGSTFVKAAAVDSRGVVLALAQHPTTSDSDVCTGLDAAVSGLGLGAVTDDALLVCSSVGGGLRLAVVGHERVISAEAGRRVALTAGARVVKVSAGELDDAGLADLIAVQPDVLMVVGGTDGGDVDVLLHNCEVLGASPLRCPVVLAGNAAAAEQGRALLADPARAVRVAANVLPRIGTLAPGPARQAIRAVFIEHVIGGKGLSRGQRFADLVVAATPDAVLAGIEVVADVLSGPGAVADVLVLDIGGATTDAYSVLAADEQAADEAVGTLWHARTVEGDLGMRWGALGVVEAAIGEQLVPAGAVLGSIEDLERAARLRHDHIGFLPSTQAQVDHDLRLARLAAVVAARRHARPGPEGSRDLTHVRLLIGSGGVLRHADEDASAAVLEAVLGDVAGGWRLPQQARAMVDRRYLLAPIGLLELTGRTATAHRLARELLQGWGPLRTGTS